MSIAYLFETKERESRPTDDCGFRQEWKSFYNLYIIADLAHRAQELAAVVLVACDVHDVRTSA